MARLNIEKEANKLLVPTIEKFEETIKTLRESRTRAVFEVSEKQSKNRALLAENIMLADALQKAINLLENTQDITDESIESLKRASQVRGYNIALTRLENLERVAQVARILNKRFKTRNTILKHSAQTLNEVLEQLDGTTEK
jgi:hypothetical protein